MAEFIFEMNEALYNEETGEACFKPNIKGKIVRCKDCEHHSERSGMCFYWSWYGSVTTAAEGYCYMGRKKST